MKERSIESLGQLKDFITVHKLTGQNSLIHFHAKVLISTDTINKQEEVITIMVFFNVFNKLGELAFHNHNLDPNYYPTIFYPDYDDFIHEDMRILSITGIHSKNPKIGRYKIEIKSLGKVKN